MGVKSLWKLLTPVGRPVMLETVEGKIMAIDSSIWIYQFQATMRDKEGRGLVNAHVLGFLRRISKLLFYGIKPVFVFDGGAPALKRSTLNERRKKKSGAATSHVKLAEKLLAAQLRREALNQAHGAQETTKTSKRKNRVPSGPLLDDDTVYLEDLDPSIPKTPVRPKPPEPSSSSSKKKNNFHDHDPYRLPEVDLDEAVAKATRAAVPDPRLATEEELRAFIEDMRPEDLDVNSNAFRELPTEVQYEIVGDLRLKSRQTSYARLQNMLRSAPTPLDFSKQQIKNLRQRNSLTQQLLSTTDSIGSAHISIPVRIASERNKEYVLMKNEGEAGGWILGIRDDGTRDKPIVLDHDERTKQVDNDSDADMEEVEVPGSALPDPDLREYNQHMALSAIGRRQTPKKLAPLKTFKPVHKRPAATPLFDLEDDDEIVTETPVIEDFEEDDPDLALALQVSLDQFNSMDVHQERLPSLSTEPSSSRTTLSTPPSKAYAHMALKSAEFHEEDDVFGSYTRLETALSIANAGPFRSPSTSSLQTTTLSSFGKAVLLSPSTKRPPVNTGAPQEDMEEVTTHHPEASHPASPSIPVVPGPSSRISTPSAEVESDSDLDMEEVIPEAAPADTATSTVASRPIFTTAGSSSAAIIPSFNASPSPSPPTTNLNEPPRVSIASPYVEHSHSEQIPIPSEFEAMQDLGEDSYDPKPERGGLFMPDDDAGEDLIEWSRSPSPSGDTFKIPDSPRAHSPTAGNWDAAQEMDPDVEEGEFARFMSQVKGKDLDDVRRDIDEEIKSLNQQRKAAMRDSEDITQQMISQIMTMLRLFGIPYITAPMEAEAQCAELVSLGLVDGVITDDSDVFLFGAQRVFKNMFNQSKTVECFLLSDLSRELGLERNTLIRLAYLLGSDYVEGLPGVGPVVAMELLKEFPGDDGLHKFKDWWMKVQSGRDTDEDNKSKFRKQFKKKFKRLHLDTDWPNSTVRDAYLHPTVDSSDEPFKWGLPDLDALRDFFRDELGWSQSKVDDLLLPIIQKMNKRGQAAAMNKQSNLTDFFDASGMGTGTLAPRNRRAYSSKRLQEVVSEFRKRSKSGESSVTPPSEEHDTREGSTSESDADVAPAKKRKTTAPAARVRGKGKRRAASSRGGRGGRGGGKGQTSASSSKQKRKVRESEAEDEDAFVMAGDGLSPPPSIKQLRPRPKPAYKGAPGRATTPDLMDGA